VRSKLGMKMKMKMKMIITTKIGHVFDDL
jgi:hypothetical protein